MHIGSRIINNCDCYMTQIAANQIVVTIIGSDTQVFYGACNNQHIDEIWAAIAVYIIRMAQSH